MKTVAEQNGHTITFMAKPFDHRFGSSSHLHISLHNLDGKNLFMGEIFQDN